jgi:23S rRNA (pseudouridine1915-N3)-methyltransferase
MIHELPFLGKTKDAYIAEGIEEYSQRLRHYTTLSVIQLKDKGKKKGRPADPAEQEGELLLQTVPVGALIVALDAGGRQYSSEGLADLLSGWEQRGVKQVSYLIGGPTGLCRAVLDKADVLLSLSKMTFTHDMVRLLLLEQLYRAYTIKAGEKYHK